MPTWLLLFALANGITFLGGEYQSEERCLEAASLQAPHWQRKLHKDQHRSMLTWQCQYAGVR